MAGACSSGPPRAFPPLQLAFARSYRKARSSCVPRLRSGLRALVRGRRPGCLYIASDRCSGSTGRCAYTLCFSWLVRCFGCCERKKQELIICGTGFNFLSHGSQDLYPTYLKTSKGFSSRDAIVATIIGNCGAITCASLTLTIPTYSLIFVVPAAVPLQAPCRSTSAAGSRLSFLFSLAGHLSRSGFFRPASADSQQARSACSLACRARGASFRSNLPR
jgi:hypothetical protein